MPDLGRSLILAGVILVVAGCIFFFAGKIPGLGRLPGDIFIQKPHFSFYFPLTTSLVVSIILSVILILCSKR